jgi:hypothetical protein
MNEQKILITVINNSGLWEGYFCMDLIKVYEETKKVYPNTEIQNIRANCVNEMRNYSCRYAMGKFGKIVGADKRYDYLVQLDTDHRYSPTFIVDLMKHGKDVVTGCTSSRHSPFKQTQFNKFIKDIRADENITNPRPDDGLIKIDSSGPVGMLIKVDVLDKLDYPYYNLVHIGDEGGETKMGGSVEATMGGDVFFCKKLKEAGFDLWLDSKITFPHEVGGVFVNRGNILL